MDVLWGIASTVGLYARDLVRDYQTLIAGLIAIIAARLAAKPVWHQLRQTATQTNLNLRHFLYDRVRIISGRQKWFVDRLGQFQNDIVVRLYEMEHDGGSINVHWAFDQDQAARRLWTDVTEHQREQRDSAEIEDALNDAFRQLKVLGDTLDAIHRPHSTSQSDEDYSISDQDWAKIEEAGRRAEGKLRGAVDSFSDAVKRVERTFNEELATLRKQIREIDQILTATRS